MSKKNIEMQVLGANGEYEQIYPVPAGHASSHGKNGTDPISPVDIGAQSEIPITSEPDENTNIWIDPNEEGESGGGGVDIPAQGTEPTTGNYWLDTSAEGGTYYTAGEVDTLLANKAPAGFGLGGQSKSISASDDLNDVVYDGWYCFDTPPINAPLLDGINAIGYSSMLVSNRMPSLYVTQEIFVYSSQEAFNCVVRRVRINGEWKPWEWVNPPMMLNTEYRTTERYQGKPVYVKAIDFGALPNTTKKHVDIDNQNHARAIRVSGLLNNGITIPGTDENQTDGSKPLQCYGYNNNVCIYAPYDASTKTAIVTVWYYKTTD